MTEVEERLCKYLLREHFGELVCRVGTELVRAGSLNLRQLVSRIGVSPKQVRKALCVLIQHGMVTFEAMERGLVRYQSVRTALLRIPRYPRYIYVAKTLYGDTGELLLEEILQHGELTMSDAIRRVADRLTETSNGESHRVLYSEVAKTFCDLVNTHFLQKCPQVIGTAVQAAAPTLESVEREEYAIPTIPLTVLDTLDDHLPDLHTSLRTLAQCSLVSIVQERFGSRPARIFRLLLSKRHLEQKQVEDFAMIPSKEAKGMLYTMLSENFISLQELPKTPDFAPARTFYLYTVKVQPTASMILQRCYKVEKRVLRLFEKSQRIEAIVASVQASGADQSQLQEIEEMITAPEQQQLDHLKASIKR
uniref:DNA-directed RNA polymerase III subunit RPC3 n=1 Tax=Eptatretus burgeri TaxID=7764 RepID=A0A8C4R5N6_EPTBU